MAEQLSSEEINDHLAALRNLETEYLAYLDGTFHGTREQSRKRILLQTAPAQRALAASGVQFAITPPPAFGGPVLTVLSQQLFAFELPAYEPIGGPAGMPYTSRLVLDALSTAESRLEDLRRNASARTTRRERPKRARNEERRRFTLFGRVKALPAAVSFIADLGTAVIVIAGALRLFGVY